MSGLMAFPEPEPVGRLFNEPTRLKCFMAFTVKELSQISIQQGTVSMTFNLLIRISK